MNIEIANRLVNLRKENNLSQEALAEKLGISRQAVSKWERAEASPDTDNLILLARLYGVSLDELLKTEDEIPLPNVEAEKTKADEQPDTSAFTEKKESEKEEYVHVGLDGVHVKNAKEEVHVGWRGIHVENEKDSVHIPFDGNGHIHVNGKEYDRKDWIMHEFPFALIIIFVYIILGVLWNLWHPGWVLFLTIPLWYSMLSAIRHGNWYMFAYPVFVTIVYIILGVWKNLWHPGWILYLTIPIYYSIIDFIRRLRKNEQEHDKEDEG